MSGGGCSNPEVTDPIRRFSGRTEEYARYRPRYPSGLVPLLRVEIGLRADWEIADIGSGTGLSCEPFLALGCRVVGVEPNPEMRRAAEGRLRDLAFRSVPGRAEATTLPETSIDLVVAGQAFHWFDPRRARIEFERILRPPAPVALFWNTRILDASPFLREYETLLHEYGTDYERVRHDTRRDDLLETFFPAGFRRHALPNQQSLDLSGLQGRLLSSSYTPAESDPGRAAMLEAAEAMFRRHQREGRVRLEYETELYVGHLRVADAAEPGPPDR